MLSGLCIYWGKNRERIWVKEIFSLLIIQEEEKDDLIFTDNTRFIYS